MVKNRSILTHSVQKYMDSEALFLVILRGSQNL